MEAHPHGQLGVGPVRNLEDDRAGQEVEGHVGDLRHVAIPCRNHRARWTESGRQY